MTNIKLYLGITFIALLILFSIGQANAQENRKDTLDAFLFSFMDAPNPITPDCSKEVLKKINFQLKREKDITIEEQIKLLVIGAEANLNLKRTQESAEFINRAESLARKQGNKKLIATVWIQRGDFLRVIIEKEKALDAYKEAIATARSAGEKFIEAEAYLHVGSLYRADENHKQAIAALEQSIATSRKNNYYTLLISALSIRSAIFRDLSKKSEALSDIDEALSIAKAQNSPYLASILNIKGSIHYRFGEIDLGLENYRKGLSQLNSQPFKDDLEATLQENIALCLKEKLQYNEAKLTLDSALNSRKQLADTNALAKNYTQQGNVSLQAGKYADALEYYLRSLELRQLAGTSSEIASSQTSIGLLYRNLGLNTKAISYFSDALDQRMAHGSNVEIGEANTHMGNAYFDIKNYNDALHYYKEAHIYRQKTKDKALEARSLNSIATAYQEMKSYNKAEAFYLEALATNPTTDIKGRAIIRNNLGNFYLAINNKEKALTNFNSALQLHKASQNLLGQGLSLRKIGEIYLTQKDYSKADSCLLASLNIGKTIKNLEHLKNTNFALYRLYFEQKDYPKALNFYVAYAQEQDSIAQTKSSEDLINARLSVEMEKKKTEITRIENEIIVLRKEAQLQESESKRQWYIVTFLIATSVLLIILGSVFYRAYRLKKQKATLLQEKYTITKNANDQLEKSEISLKRLNATKDKFFAIIAHDLKSPFNALLGLSELLKQRASELTPDDVLEYGNAIHASSAKLFTLLENLLQWARTQTGKIPFNPTVFDLTEILTSNISIQELTAKIKNITIKSDSKENFKVEADLDMVNTILRNLLTNAVKFTPSGGRITISTVSENDRVAISVTDTGAGMSQEEMNLLFRLDVHYTTKGTENESGTGLGLIICKEFVEQNNGEITVSSKVGQGTTFTFTLPIRKTL